MIRVIKLLVIKLKPVKTHSQTIIKCYVMLSDAYRSIYILEIVNGHCLQKWATYRHQWKAKYLIKYYQWNEFHFYLFVLDSDTTG